MAIPFYNSKHLFQFTCMKPDLLIYRMLLLFAGIIPGAIAFPQLVEKPNILFVISDDLNDYLEGYDANINTLTPNINLLRENGTIFLNAYASAPICAPSRTSFLSGKDLKYTQVYKNADNDYKCKEFGDNFTAAEGNEVYYTIPQYLKDSLGYYTYNLNKVFHCHKNYIEYDESTSDPCSKTGAWNKYFYYNDSIIIQPAGVAMNQGVPGYDWAAIDDSLEQYMADYIATDSVISFINQYAANPEEMCNKPFMIMLGYQKPHAKQYIPKKYFLPEYLNDFYSIPMDIPYNYPTNNYPLNGITLPPQPDTPFADLDALLMNSISTLMVKNTDTQFMNWPLTLAVLPEVEVGLAEVERISILEWSKRANAVMSYLAAIQFIDNQFGKVFTSLLAQPEIMNNTIIIFIGDNGYSLGEKRHWAKYGLWDTDVRIPLIIADMRNPNAQICNRTVSLLDLFPTLVELTGGTIPLFPDSSAYFDGKSIVSLLQNPDTMWTRPVISTTKKELKNAIGDCFPHYSVRDERFHLITYRTNGDIVDGCDSVSSVLEYELYEIGVHRETDPFEWKNLGYQPEYAPVIQYLNQWLPYGPLYMQKTYTAQINDGITDCSLEYGQSINLTFNLFDTTGNSITGPEHFIYRWTNNLSDDTLFGTEITFPTSMIAVSDFSASSKLFIYFEMVDTINQAIAAFDMDAIQINETSIPEISFSAVQFGSNTIIIDDFEITGSYTSYDWDFGFGPIFHNTVPGPVYLDDIASVTISCTATYGNSDTCAITLQKIFTNIGLQNNNHNELLIFPNPSQDVVNVFCEKPLEGNEYLVYDAIGNLIYSTASATTAAIQQINITGWPAGMYHINVQNDSTVFSGSFIITR